MYFIEYMNFSEFLYYYYIISILYFLFNVQCYAPIPQKQVPCLQKLRNEADSVSDSQGKPKRLYKHTQILSFSEDINSTHTHSF